MSFYLVILLFFLVAFLYSSVGHGGASGFIAVMVLVQVSMTMVKPAALILNILVSSMATYQYYRSNYFNKNIFIPLVITSIPFAFLGSLLHVSQYLFKILLGLCLVIAVGRMLFVNSKMESNENKKMPIGVALFIGASIGLVSGMIGIGGGIILSPILILANWSSQKQAAAISAPFILVNSISGITGASIAGFSLPDDFVFWVIAAVAGGAIGSYLGARKYNQLAIKYVLSLVMLIAATKLFIR